MAETRSEPSTPSPGSPIILVAPHPDEPPPPYPSQNRRARWGRIGRGNSQGGHLHSQISSRESDYEVFGGSPATQPLVALSGNGGQHAFPNSFGDDHEANESTPLLPSSPRGSVRRQGVSTLVVNGMTRQRTISHSSTIYSSVSGSPSLAQTLYSAFQPNLDSDIDGDDDAPVDETRHLDRAHDPSESSNEQEQDGCVPETQGPTVKVRLLRYFRPMWRRAYYSAVFHLLVLNFPFALAAWVYLFVFTLTGTTLLVALPLGALLCFLDLLGARIFSRAELSLQSTFHGPLAYMPYPARPIFYRLRPPTISEMESGLSLRYDTSFYRNAYAMFTDATSYQALFYFLVIKPSLTLLFGITLIVLVPMSFVFVLPAPAMLRIVRRVGMWQANVAVEGLYLAVR